MYLILAPDERAALLREWNATIWAHVFKGYKKDVGGRRASPPESSAAWRGWAWCNAPACASAEQANSCLYLERNSKCEMLWPRKQRKRNSSFCLQTHFFFFGTFENLSALKHRILLHTDWLTAACGWERFLWGNGRDHPAFWLSAEHSALLSKWTSCSQSSGWNLSCWEMVMTANSVKWNFRPICDRGHWVSQCLHFVRFSQARLEGLSAEGGSPSAWPAREVYPLAIPSLHNWQPQNRGHVQNKGKEI